MKLLPLLTLIISAIVALSGISDLTRPSGVQLALFGLLGVAISGGALAIYSAVEAIASKGESSTAMHQTDQEAEMSRRAAIARRE